jgi:hypothetical protein
MADSQPVEDLVLEEVKRVCTGQCPYKWGDGESQINQLKGRIKHRLRFRVAWGHEVRLLEKKFKKLRDGLRPIL